MRRRPILTAGMTAIAAVLATSVAVAGPTVAGPNGNTQSIEVKLAPKLLSKTAAMPVSLNVTTKTTSTSAANGVPIPAVRAVVDFPKGTSIFTKGIPTCDPAKLQNTSTEDALRACSSAKIGGGAATVLLIVGEKVFTEPTTVTAFNSAPKGGKPVVLLHVFGAAPVQTTQVLVGVVSNYNKEGYGPRLDVSIPLIANGAGALTDFNVVIKKKYRYQGKLRSFASAICKPKTLKSRGAFTYRDGQTLTAVSTQKCRQKKEALRR
jgi:hypothetical protein